MYVQIETLHKNAVKCTHIRHMDDSFFHFLCTSLGLLKFQLSPDKSLKKDFDFLTAPFPGKVNRTEDCTIILVLFKPKIVSNMIYNILVELSALLSYM